MNSKTGNKIIACTTARYRQPRQSSVQRHIRFIRRKEVT